MGPVGRLEPRSGASSTSPDGVFEGVALTAGPTRQVPQFPGQVNAGIMLTVSLVWTNTTGTAVPGPG